ncbi:putative ferric-chelate reductase 1 isoform X2 [Nematostella vectensis]|uniref:putative ferric-chelate reductase 1 isoform X2 n=2 Tax=Nematostella vectensis TaxID=45351 RepID=UPI00138FA773|nr:putative ferric-chelate reductase 1 isoform X2 [Nematostella vectensis]
MAGRPCFLMIAVLLAVSLAIPSCLAFPDYPPTTTCQELTPKHGSHTPRTEPSPYSITVTPGSYTPGSEVSVAINGISHFKGFIMQARQAGHSGPPYPIGTFNSPLPAFTQKIWCSGGDYGNTVGHNHSKGYNFTSVTLKWRAPDKAAGNIIFWASVVETFDRFWVDLKSVAVSGASGLPSTTPPLGRDFQISKSGCGKAKGCFSEPVQCTGSHDCTFLMTYQDNGSDVTFELSAKAGYAAMGFNYKQEMDATDSITCSTSASGAVEIRRYYLDHHRPTRYDISNTSDIKAIEKSYADGIVKCRFTRKKAPQSPNMRNLNTNWYMIFAWSGVSTTGVLEYHHKNSSFTAEKVDMTKPALLVSGKPQPSASPSDKITKVGCGKTKACVSEPKNCRTSSDCQYLMTYTVENDDVIFHMSTSLGWSAIGFNSKPRMDDTDALICSRTATSGDSVGVAHYEITGYGKPVKNTQTSKSLQVFEAEYSGGIVYCKFSRKKQSLGMMDLNKKVYLIFARGQISAQGDLRQHSPREKSYTTDPVAITSLTDLKVTEGKDLSLLRGHAILMSIAWLVCASLSMFVARYMREVWGEIFGLKAWFQVHRGLMVLTLVFSVVGIVLAFVYAGGWSETKIAHPLIGMIVLALACIQPVMAYFRPKPGTDKRVVFNWAHRSVGVISLALAVVNCFLGVLLPHFELQTSGTYPLIAYCAGVGLVILFEIYLACKARSQSSANLEAKADIRNEDVEVKTKQVKPVEQYKSLKKIVMGFLCLLVLGVTLALIALVVTRPLEE